jgi:hypothetical protein
MEKAMQLPFVGNEPFEVTRDSLLAAAVEANELGLELAHSAGDVAYHALHA